MDWPSRLGRDFVADLTRLALGPTRDGMEAQPISRLEIVLRDGGAVIFDSTHRGLESQLVYENLAGVAALPRGHLAAVVHTAAVLGIVVIVAANCVLCSTACAAAYQRALLVLSEEDLRTVSLRSAYIVTPAELARVLDALRAGSAR